MAAVLRARTLLSTTGGGVESAPHGDALEGLEVEVFEYRPRLTVGQGVVVSFNQHHTIAEDTIRQRRRRFVQEDEIDRPAGRLLEISNKRACLTCVE